MARALKCWLGNYDGRHRGLVITTTKKRAAEIAGTSLHHFGAYWAELASVPLGFEPETLYTISYQVQTPRVEDHSSLWTKKVLWKP